MLFTLPGMLFSQFPPGRLLLLQVAAHGHLPGEAPLPQSFSNTSLCFIFLPVCLTRADLSLPQSLLCRQHPAQGT